MHFARDPDPPEAAPAPDHPAWRRVLFGSAFATAFATLWPWLQVKLERLWGAHDGPPGWQSSVGFTCLTTSVLVAVMALAETGSPRSHEAVRPGSLMLVALATSALVLALLEGPGSLGGVSAAWTSWFYVVCASLPLLMLCCVSRWAMARQRSH